MTHTILLTVTWLFCTSAPLVGEQLVMELEWGFETTGDTYWDGTVKLDGGRLVTMKAVSFERDRHDRLTPPSFKSFTTPKGTDGMELVIEGDASTSVTVDSKEGKFTWTIKRLRQEGSLEFPSKSKGKLKVSIIELLGELPTELSDGKTQDSDPAVCRLNDGRMVVFWRAFLGLPGPGETPSVKAGTGDQIRGRILDSDNEQTPLADLLDAPGDVETVVALPAGLHGALLIWAEQRKGNWDLFARTASFEADSVKRSPIERLTEDAGVDKSPVLATTGDGEEILVWQGWRGQCSSVFAMSRTAGKWGQPLLLSDGQSNAWNPALAVSADGRAAVSWSSWRNGSYDVLLRVRQGSQWQPALTVADTQAFEAHPSLAFDRNGRLWITYEEGRIGWGMHSHTAGLRSRRDVRLRLLRHGSVEEPTGTTAFHLTGGRAGNSEMAHLAVDGGGTPWLLFRQLGGRGVWQIAGSALRDEGWASPRPLRRSAGGQNVRMATTLDATGRLVAAWSTDDRVNQVGKDSRIVMTRFASSRPGRTAPVTSQKLDRPAGSSEPAPASERPTITLAGRKAGLYFGDLHRHTELSVCRTGVDGSLEDAYRYAIDAAGLDFLCITDHVQHVKLLNDYDYWRSGKTADLHRVAGRHLPFYGYERSQRYSYGHRNIVGLQRSPPRVPRTADNRPWSANSGYPGEVRLDPPQLWERLRDQSVITIPHTSGNPTMGTDFAHRPAEIEPVVEIYQGCRISYEHAMAPDPRQRRDGDRFGGATQDGGYIWDALAKGYRYGFIASSDHMATGNSFTCVWSPEFSSKAIHEALFRRCCYAATAKMICEMRMGGHFMGQEFATASIPPLEVRAIGTTEIDRIDVIRDNRVVFTHRPEKPTNQVSLRYQDRKAQPGEHYYYARVIQKDRNLAWVSPIWVRLQVR